MSRFDRRVFRRTAGAGRTRRNLPGASTARGSAPGKRAADRQPARQCDGEAEARYRRRNRCALRRRAAGSESLSPGWGIRDFTVAIGPETTIIPTLNGMRHIDILEEHFGRQAVAGGVCKVAATIDAEGRIVQLAQFQELAYGERDGLVSRRIEELDAFMQGAGFD